jgi:Tfp pilus assembly protein PilE
MNHTRCSQTYRKHFMPGHPQQCHAAMMAMRDLMERYQAGVIRHRKRLIKALKTMEQVA